MKTQACGNNRNSAVFYKKLLAVSAFVCFFVSTAVAAEKSDGSNNDAGQPDIFLRLEAKEKETKSVSFKFVQKVEFDMHGYVQENAGSVVFGKPENIRIELVKPVRQITVSDGKTLRSYSANTNQMIISDWKKIKETGMLFGWPDSFAGNIAGLREKYSLSLVESSSETVRLSLEDKKSGIVMTMSFDAETLVPRATELISKGVKITTVINEFQRNPKLSRDTFKFVPPRGAEVIRL